MKYLSTFSGIGGFELGIQQAYAQKRLNENGNCDILTLCKRHAHTANKQSHSQSITVPQRTLSGVKNVQGQMLEKGLRETLKNTERQVENVERKTEMSTTEKEGSITKKDDKTCWICMEESATVVVKQSNNSSLLNTQSGTDTKTGNNTELGTCTNSPLKRKILINTKSFATTATMPEGDTESAPTCVGFSEIDKYAKQIYSRHFPDHLDFGDITTIDTATLPDFDLLVGGFPCQAFSIAGKRRGFEDTRGTMFFELARILRAKQPRLFVFENVKGLLSHDNGNTFKTIIATLSELGYDCQWQLLNSKNHGVPQNRERIFIIGHLRGTPRPKVFPFIGEGKQYSTVGKSTETTVARTLTGGGHSGGNHSGMTIIQLNEPTHSNDRVYGADGISPTLNTMQGGNRQPFVRIPEATKKGYADATVGQSINLSVMGSKTRRGRVSDVAQTLDTGMQQHTLTNDMKIRRLTPIECERLQGFPDGWTEGVSDTQRYKTLGNAVTVNVIRDIIDRLFI